MRRVLLILFVVSALCPVTYASEEDPFNVDLVCGWRGYYRPMEWTPMEIQLGAGAELSEPFAGSITISTQQDGLNTMNITHEFVLTPEVRLHMPLVTKLAFAVNKCDVRIANEKGRTQWQQDFNLYDLSMKHQFMTAVHDNDLLIGVVGRMGFGLLRLPKQSLSQYEDKTGKVYVGDKVPGMVPWDWTGFVPLDLLVLYDPDWNLFKPEQLNAIAQWVSNGGNLLLVLGNHPLANTNPIASLLPCSPRNRKSIMISPETMETWGLGTDTAETVIAWSLIPKPGARFYNTKVNDANECLLSTAYAGFGRVGVLPYDPATMASTRTANSSAFWVFHMSAILEDDAEVPDDIRTPRSSSVGDRRRILFVEDADIAFDDRDMRRQYEVGRMHNANNAIMEFLYQGIQPLSIWWVILLLTGLAVLLGPVDYKLLKHYGRLPLTWLTCTFWIFLFTICAYFGVQALRGGQLELRVVSVLDGIEKSDHTWSTYYCGLFAPKSDDYRLKDLQKNQWWSGIAPTGRSVGMQGQEGIGKSIYCLQHDGGNLPYSLPVNIWDVQCLLNESSLSQMPFSAKVERRGDEVIIDIINESKSPIVDGFILVDNKHGARFGSVRAGATKQYRKRIQRMSGWGAYSSEYYRTNPREQRPAVPFKKNSVFFAQGSLQRTQALDAYLERGAAVVCVEYDQPPVSFGLEGRSSNLNHVQLARLVVFPQGTTP